MSLKNDWATTEWYTAAAANDVANAINALTGWLISVKDYGAVGDGTTDDSAAFVAAFTDAVDSYVVAPIGLPSHYTRSQITIYVPPGTYKITTQGAMMQDLTSDAMAGINWRGAGPNVTFIVFSPSTADQYLCINPDDFKFYTMSDMAFGSTVASASFMKSTSTTGQPQNIVFSRVNWVGTWKYGFDLQGTDGCNGEMTWFQCNIYDDWTAFLFNGSPGSANNEGFVNYNFYGTNAETDTGDLVNMHYGGDINMWGGSLIHRGDAGEDDSSAQCVFRFGGSGTPVRLHASGVRVEHRHENSQLINCARSGGNIDFLNCNTDIFQSQLTNPENVIQAEFDSTASRLPQIRFSSCSLMGTHKYHYDGNQWSRPHRIEYDTCEISTHVRAADFISYVNDDATGNTSGKPAITFTNCRSYQSLIDYKESFDTTVNWHDSVNAVVTPKVLSVRMGWGGLPGAYDVTTAYATLPLNAIITGVRCFKGAGGTSTATNVTYTLTDADTTTIATATTAGAAWNTSWGYDSGLLRYVCSTDNKRTLTVTAANINERAYDSYFLIEYLA